MPLNISDYKTIYVTTDKNDHGAELRCTEHPDWYADADGTDLPMVAWKAEGHFAEEHSDS